MPVKIAIVDDKSIVRKAIKDKLYSSGEITIVMEASNGEEFLEKMNESAADLLPQIVLMDLEMPEMDGIQTIAIASILFPGIKFIVLTIFDNNEKIFEAIKAGANGYLLKDDDAINLNEAILHVVNYNAVPMSPAIARKTLGLLKTGFSITSGNISTADASIFSKKSSPLEASITITISPDEYNLSLIALRTISLSSTIAILIDIVLYCVYK